VRKTKKTNSLAKKYQRTKQSTLTLEQEKLFDSNPRIPEENNEEVTVIENLPIALRKEKRSCI